MKIGFIGTGNMGSMLVESFIRSGAVPAGDIMICNRTASKALELARKHPGIAMTESKQELMEKSRWVFLCVKPMDYKTVIDEIRRFAREEQILVSITSPVIIEDLEKQLPSKIVKMIPSITNAVLSGVVLMTYGNRMTLKEAKSLEKVVSCIGTPILISERHTRICSDLSSCGPAFIAFFIRQWARAAAEETGLSLKDAEQLASEMIHGVGKLLVSGMYTPEELQEKVSVPGGVTAEGIRVLARDWDGVFNRLIRATHRKFNEDLEKVKGSFAGG